MADADLKKMLDEKRVALRAFRLSITGSKVKNIREGRVIRKTIARTLTEMHSRVAKAMPATITATIK